MTRSDPAEEAAPPLYALRDGPNAQTRAHARARRVLAALTQRYRAVFRVPAPYPGRPRADSVAALAEPPASITELLTYLRAAAWVPSPEEHPLLVAAGRAYGYVVAVPGSLVLYGMAWLIQRPARLALAIALALIVPLTA